MKIQLACFIITCKPCLVIAIIIRKGAPEPYFLIFMGNAYTITLPLRILSAPCKFTFSKIGTSTLWLCTDAYFAPNSFPVFSILRNPEDIHDRTLYYNKLTSWLTLPIVYREAVVIDPNRLNAPVIHNPLCSCRMETRKMEETRVGGVRPVYNKTILPSMLLLLYSSARFKWSIVMSKSWSTLASPATSSRNNSPTRFSSSLLCTEYCPRAKWRGASRWVPPCSAAQNRYDSYSKASLHPASIWIPTFFGWASRPWDRWFPQHNYPTGEK